MSRNRHRLLRTFLLVALLALAGFVGCSVKPSTAEAQIPFVDKVCGVLPDGAVESGCNAATDPIGTIAGAIGVPTLDELGGDLVQAVFGPLANRILDAEVNGIISVLRVTYTKGVYANVSLEPPWYKETYDLIKVLSAVLAGILMCVVLVVHIWFRELHDHRQVLIGWVLLFGLVPNSLKIAEKFRQGVMNDAVPGIINLALGDLDKTLDQLEVDFHSTMGVVTSFGEPLVFLGFGWLLALFLKLVFIVAAFIIILLVAATIITGCLVVLGKWGIDKWLMVVKALLVFTALPLVSAFCLLLTLGGLGNNIGFMDGAALLGFVLVNAFAPIWVVNKLLNLSVPTWSQVRVPKGLKTSS